MLLQTALFDFCEAIAVRNVSTTLYSKVRPLQSRLVIPLLEYNSSIRKNKIFIGTEVPWETLITCVLHTWNLDLFTFCVYVKVSLNNKLNEIKKKKPRI